MTEARLYERQDNKRVHCVLCAHECRIADGRRGFCNVRENRDGTLYTLVYGGTIAEHPDPVEKKPLYHFYPGSRAYSLAAPGCNFRCRWCQNCQISQLVDDTVLKQCRPAAPEDIVERAERSQCGSIAYTYTEPTVFFEYAHDIATIAREHGLANIYVTNGFMTEPMLETAVSWLDAAAVDLKAFSDVTYRKYMGTRLQPVLDSLKWLKAHNVWIEVTTLVIPDVNDSDAELTDIAGFIAAELGPDTPWHVSRFFPAYRMTGVPPTPPDTLRRARSRGRQAGLNFVYIGNVAEETPTACPHCDKVLIRRSRGFVEVNRTAADGSCPGCGTALAGVGMGALNSG